ncbi:Non-repetitive/WGA-negative nucleoporin C-terminal-domain-containing protein [Irpex rosettiformis]|uniref:Non-repetitive/WGA-negative nucleoporin C-terminal-domain-containing protein n=1 Tax=Irpex rosettiformis TaxID=378272 RepID=A0ACB8UIL4_9APHY|nr:Non-repetitive/WGA-negative nucleoporin C-terminal-domain-containing protein [Irpex rosettiformis]
MAVDTPTPIPEDESMSSIMDVDDRGSEIGLERGLKPDTIFAKSEEMQVSFYAHLPEELKKVLRSADFYREGYTGQVDTLTGFALVASAERCFVWNYSQALTGTPTCYIFACPQDAEPLLMDTPLHGLIPYGTSREPGLILASPEGNTRCWDSLGMGLAGGERAFETKLEVAQDERITTLTRADAQTFIVSTSNGRLFRLTLTALAGKHVLTTHPFSRPNSSLSLSRLFPLSNFFSSPVGTQVEPGYISAVALSHGDSIADAGIKGAGRDIWTLIDSRIQRWNMSVEGAWEELVLDQDISDIIGPEVRTRFTRLAEQDDAELDLEFLDLQVVKSGSLLILVSFAVQDDQLDYSASVNPSYATAPKRIYCIVPLSYNSTTGIFSIDKNEKIVKVPYQSTSSSGAPMHPRMQLLSKVGPSGSIIAIQFGETVVLCAPLTEYTDRLELKSATNRTFGVAVLPLEDEEKDEGLGEKNLIVLAASTLMRVLVDRDHVAQFKPATGRANLIRSTMTQAILYGSHPENPLQFSFPPDVDEEALMSGAEQLSEAIMESDTEVVKPNHDLSAQIAHRRERLSFLIKFINDNGVLTKMSQSSRQTLAVDAETLYVADQLWQRHNKLISYAPNHPCNVLTEAVYMYMSANDEDHHEDFMRAFFRKFVRDLGSLLPHILEVLKRSEHEVTYSRSETIPQANDALLIILQNALAYRKYNKGVYGLELPITRPWTSTLQVIDIASEFFEATTKQVELPATTVEPTISRTQARSQFPELAITLFSAYSEQVQWLSSPRAASEAGNERERADLEERFKQARPVILDALRRNGFQEQAFELAERYRDFRSLASLCHKEKIYPPEENPHAKRIQSYIDKFREEFASELYQWYIEHGELRTLYALDQPAHLDKFFAEHEYPNISWIHDIERGRYGLAANSLLSEAQHAPELSSKHLMLSIGKLACLAQAQEDATSADEQTLDAFHDGLDFVSVHEALAEELKTALANVRARQSIDMQVDIIARAKATRISDRRALFSIFKQLVKRLLQGKALSVEDAADVLSLKDNDSSIEDYITALHLLCQAQIPDARKLSAFRAVWRRIYLHNDWNQIRQTVGITDDEVTSRFRRTAFHDALMATTGNEHSPEGYVLLPSDALPVPTQAEVASRWPGIPPDDVAALAKDYESESQELANLRLEDVVDRVRELANEDMQWS